MTIWVGRDWSEGKTFPFVKLEYFLYCVSCQKYWHFGISPDRGPQFTTAPSQRLGLWGMRSIGKAMGKIKKNIQYQPEREVRAVEFASFDEKIYIIDKQENLL
jgi:hypothetical protein